MCRQQSSPSNARGNRFSGDKRLSRGQCVRPFYTLREGRRPYLSFFFFVSCARYCCYRRDVIPSRFPYGPAENAAYNVQSPSFFIHQRRLLSPLFRSLVAINNYRRHLRVNNARRALFVVFVRLFRGRTGAVKQNIPKTRLANSKFFRRSSFGGENFRFSLVNCTGRPLNNTVKHTTERVPPVTTVSRNPIDR